MNRDGSNLRRLTNHPGDRHHADLVADRHADRVHLGPIGHAADLRGRRRRAEPGASGPPDGYCDRPTWSPAPYNEIAFASRNGPGFDIRVIDLATGAIERADHSARARNESPAYSPNGRHIVFTSTRSGKTQVFTMARDGKDVQADHADREQRKAGLVQDDWRIDDESGPADSAPDRSRGRVDGGGRLRRQESRRSPARCPAAAGDAAARAPSRPPAPPQPVAEPTIVPPEPVRDDAIASASLDESEPELAAEAGVLRARQQRAERRRRRQTLDENARADEDAIPAGR